MSTSYMTTMTGSSYTMAKRNGGVCQGSLWRTIDPGSGGDQGTSSSSFALLVGVQLICYESLASLQLGHHPTATYSVVGASAMSEDPTAFRVVSDQGSHLLCSTPTRSCRDVWLSALYAGLECRMNSPCGNNNNPHRHDPSQKRLPKVRPKLRGSILGKSQRYCHSCGKLERFEFPLSPNLAPLPQYGIEERVDLCPKCDLAQGMVDHCHWLEELYQTQQQEHTAMLQARQLILNKLEGKAGSPKKGETQQPAEMEEPERDEHGRLTPKSQTLQLKPLSHNLVEQVLESPQGLALQRLSPTLKSLCTQFQQGMIGVLEFMELVEHAMGIRDPAMAELKKEAFRVAGDMGTALKLLYEQCLPHASGSGEEALLESSSSHMNENSRTDPNANSIELLQCILEFFLDLVEEGELHTLAFFWPQISNIHLQMLPPRDTTTLQKIEMLEDFLLTVASKYSIHLAIQLVWSHVADLEDALSGNHNTTATCGQRKSAVLRFLCELESLLFDFDNGWGGGSVTVGHFLSPSNHQIDLLKDSMDRIQWYRLADEQNRLSRSHRLYKLQYAQKQVTKSPEMLAQEALRIAKNADYLSSHLAFTKRLCDIAEKLRFLPVDERAGTLQEELSKLNASGTMGGDPLNRIKKRDQDHTRVVRIPITEGHVFRSKERTPVLLLVETMDEGAEEDPSLGLESVEEEKEADANASEVLANDDAMEEEKKEINASESNGVVEPTKETDSPPDNDAESSPEHTDATENGDDHAYQDDVESQSSPQDAKPAPQTPSERKRVQSLDATGLMTPVGSSSHHKKMNSMHSFQSENSASMVGSQHDDESTARHALRRFESPATEPKIMTPTTSKAVVESLVTNVVAKQLDLPNLMQEEIVEGDEQEGTDKSEEDFNETDSDDDVKKATSKDEPDVKDKKASSEKKRTSLPKPSKMSTLSSGGSQKKEAGIKLSKTGDTRREVLTAIMMKGLSGSHVIAEQAATGAQRHLQDLERRVAVEALLTADSDIGSDNKKKPSKDDTRQELLSLGIRSASTDDLDELPKSEDDETMEAIRLILIQYRVAKGSISANDAAAALAPRPRRSAKPNGKSTMMHFGKEFPEIDAGDIDGRLVGCGVLPPAVLQALTLWKGGMISNGELLELVKKDLEFEKYTQDVGEKTDKLNEDSAFWGRFAFGERWAEKRSRLAALSPDSNQPGWDLSGVIVKSNDDLRQESFIMQLIELCQEAFQEAELELWLLPYRIISTGRTTGIIEMVRNAMSFDALKKRPGYGAGGLREHLQRMTQYEANPSEAFQTAQRNFVRSLASYSLLSYLFLFKDRHNGNLLLDTAGHVIHIDFGFVFGVAPGGAFSLELSTPFKLTDEMIDVMDGLRSSLFSEFVTLFCCGFLALQAHCDTFMTLVEVTARGSTFKCFEGRDTAEIVGKLQERFRPELGKEDTIAHVLDIIKESIGSYGTTQYDYFQYISQGIAM